MNSVISRLQSQNKSHSEKVNLFIKFAILSCLFLAQNSLIAAPIKCEILLERLKNHSNFFENAILEKNDALMEERFKAKLERFEADLLKKKHVAYESLAKDLSQDSTFELGKNPQLKFSDEPAVVLQVHNKLSVGVENFKTRLLEKLALSLNSDIGSEFSDIESKVIWISYLSKLQATNDSNSSADLQVRISDFHMAQMIAHVLLVNSFGEEQAMRIESYLDHQKDVRETSVFGYAK